ncbi:hypothetical protein FJT64_014780 [Amphibalanus amphitrite]|uniref:Endonuclease/exonuclease/phosphatase domain-containing protein n=1 Tax=Amphibalanus amphitrite TaxID=1232801 RepID=A0A6A4UXY4_AMPAM|nr:hypothetical protein FJT64_014780 [Amphibalanus amphitrite]
MRTIGDIATAHPDKALLAAGDFNVPELGWTRTEAGWAAPTVLRRTRRAEQLLDGCHLAGLKQYVGQPTRGGNVLDLVMSSGLPIEAEVRDGVFPSDHREVACTVQIARAAVPLVTRQTALNYRRADWEGLRTSLSRTPWILLDGLPVDEAADRFYDLLDAAIRDHIPVVTLRRRQPPWFDGELRAALREKEGAHRRLKRHRTPVTEEAFRQQRGNFKSLASQKFYEFLVLLGT